MKDLYKLNLNWKKDADKLWYCKIWHYSILRIEHNREDFYNIFMYDSYGNEIDSIKGATTMKQAKLNAEEWIARQLENFMEKI